MEPQSFLGQQAGCVRVLDRRAGAFLVFLTRFRRSSDGTASTTGSGCGCGFAGTALTGLAPADDPTPHRCRSAQHRLIGGVVDFAFHLHDAELVHEGGPGRLSPCRSAVSKAVSLTTDIALSLP